MTPGASAGGGGKTSRGRNALSSLMTANQVDPNSGEKGSEGDQQQKPSAQAAARADSPTASSSAVASDGNSPSSMLTAALVPAAAAQAAPGALTGCDDIEAQNKSSPSDENSVSGSTRGDEAPAGGRSADNSQCSSTYRDRAVRSRARAGGPPLEVSTHTPGGGVLAGGTGPPSSRRYNNFKTPRQTNVTLPSGADALTNSPATDAMLDAIDVGSGIQRLMVVLRSLAGRYGFASALEFLESRNSLFPQVVHDAFSALFDRGHEGHSEDGFDDGVDIEQQNPRAQSPDDTSAMGNETYGGGSVVDIDNNNAALLHDVQIRSFDDVHFPEEQKRMLQKISGEYLDIWCLEDCVKLGTVTDAKKAGRGHVDQSSVVAVLKLLQALNFYQSVTYLRVMAENGVPPKKEYSKKWFGMDKTTDQRNNFQDWWTAVVFSGKFDNIPGWVSQVKARHLGGALKDVNNYDLVLKSFGDKTIIISDLEKLRALSTSVHERVEEMEQAEAKEAKKKKKKGKKGGKG